MKKVASLLIAVMLIGMMPFSAFAATGATGKYLDAAGAEQDIPEATAITSGTEELTPGWYTVSGKVNVNRAIKVYGDVNIVLMDDADLSVKGIRLETSDTSLTIYAQPAGTGKLTAVAGQDSAIPGIGSKYEDRCGNITINGGIITASGGYYGAGIGCGYYGSCGDITINGGYVTATSNYGAGIGSIFQGSCGNITINGGTVTATSNDYGAGIGSGYEGSCGDITINDGYVTATSNDGAGIGSGGGSDSSCGNITINDGYVTATGNYGADIGAGYGSACGTVTVAQEHDGVYAGHRCLNCKYIAAVEGQSCTGYPHPAFYYNCIDGKYYKAMPFTQDNFIGETENEAISAIKTGEILPHSDIFVDGGYHRCAVCGKIEEHSFDENGKCTCGIGNKGDADRLFALPNPDTGESVLLYAPEKPTELTAGGTYGGGWYILSGKKTINGRITFSKFNSKDDAETHLILADGADITVNGGIGTDYSTLTIYAQSAGQNMGRLTVENVADGYSGIGTYVTDMFCREITVNGGRITATGGKGGAGIGAAGRTIGHLIVINGGCIKAKSSENGPGFGTAYDSINYAPYCTYADIDGWSCVNIECVDAVQPTCTKAGHIAYYADLWSGRYYTDFSLAEDKLIGDGDALAAWLAEGGAGYAGDTLDHRDDDGNRFCDACGRECYYDYDASLKRMVLKALVPENTTVINKSADTLELTDGWYMVKGKVEIESGIAVKGNAHLVIADNSSLAVKKGILLAEGKTLAIYSQSFGSSMGVLTVTDVAENCAGIGTGPEIDCEGITINGCGISVIGGYGGAGIGSGLVGNCKNVTINCGTVNVKGGMGAAGIGGGFDGDCISVTVNGGYIETTGGKQIESGLSGGAGIGGGMYGEGGDVYVNGGTVRVFGYNNKTPAFGKAILEQGSAATLHVGEGVSAYLLNASLEKGDKFNTEPSGIVKTYSNYRILVESDIPNDIDDPVNPFNPGEHIHLGILQPGAAATENSAGYKDCYECSCGKFFEDAACTVEITDLDAWKAEGGNGYIAPLSGEKDTPTSPQTGDTSNMTLWIIMMALSSMGLCVCLIFGKRKRTVK